MAQQAQQRAEIAPLDHEQALELAKALPEDKAEALTEYLEALRTRNVVVLGENEAFALRDSQGEIRAYQSVLRLSTNDGTLVQIGSKENSPYVISAQGYEKWANAAGAIVMNAPEVLFEGRMVQNPHVVREPKHNHIIEIYCRAIAFMYSDKGIPMVSDRTTIFDVPRYRMIDLLAKAKWTPQAFKLLPKGMKPEEKGTWAEYPFDDSTSLWVDTSHKEAIDFFSQVINREKKAIEFAQTFAQRNALKHLAGEQRSKTGKTMTMKVTCWRPTSGNLIKWDQSRYAVAQKALASVAGGNQDAMQITSGSDYIDDEPEVVEEIQEEVEAETETEESPKKKHNEVIDIEPEDSKPDQPVQNGGKTKSGYKITGQSGLTQEEIPLGKGPAVEDPVFKQLRAAEEAVPELVQQAMKKLGIKEIVNAKQAKDVLARANTLADGE